MGSNYGIKYYVDIVMCIDATCSMGNLLDTVKAHALSFYSDLLARMGKKRVDQLRVKLVVFRDYIADGRDAMLVTDFYTLPNQSALFQKSVNSIEPFGGGDDPEDGLEALAYAMNSNWTQDGDKRRHIIVVWSDDGTHELGFGAKAPNYPRRMARDFDELSEWWGDSRLPGIMDNNAKRLIIFAPAKEYWDVISESWDNILHFPSEAGQGLRDVDYEQILDAIVNSI